ncbi:MAG: bifunctional phosphoribosylaminoimidazolecarboxamide formyltransferase/IMP cyclohydrolase [Bacteroidota bacterium]
MSDLKKIKTALISVYHKENLDEIIKILHSQNIRIISTGGTKSYIEKLGIPVVAVEDITTYPSILGGRVKTLHPKIFGGILGRRDDKGDKEQMTDYGIDEIDLVIVDLYPFSETVKSGASHEEIIEKIDIGGISLIRAAAKNFRDVVIVPSSAEYGKLKGILLENNGETGLLERYELAMAAFDISSSYDSDIFRYFDREQTVLKENCRPANVLRYGENPHQKGVFYGNLDAVFDKLHGKEISYNNLLDIDAAICLIAGFGETTCAILKHNNACGIASRQNLTEAWKDALAGDPVSAFGGIIIVNREVDVETAEEMNRIFFEVVIAPSYTEQAMDILKTKKNRIILALKDTSFPSGQFRTLLNGVLWQEKDLKTDYAGDMKVVTGKTPDIRELEDLEFAAKLVKHTKSNAIVLVKDKRLAASGTGQTSRVDALKQAIEKATAFGFDLKGAVMASDAFFPFADCVEIAHKAGITAVVQPGGSVRDQDSIDYCNKSKMAMVFTGSRHFKH